MNKAELVAVIAPKTAESKKAPKPPEIALPEVIV